MKHRISLIKIHRRLRMTKIEDMHQEVKNHIEALKDSENEDLKLLLAHLDRLFTYVTNYVERIG